MEEKNMAKTPLITINNWQTGIADSPVLGFGNMVGIDTWSYPGAIKPVPKPTSNLNVFTPYYIVNGNKKYALGDNGTNGKVYSSSDATSWAEATGYGTTVFYGARYWQGYLFGFHGTAIDVFDGASMWSNAWGGLTLTSSVYHPSCASGDGKLYIGGANVLSRVAVNTPPFAPGTAGSYTATAAALNLPTGTVIRGIVDLNKPLMLLTTTGIYPWDRTSSSFNLPLFTQGTAHAGITIDNILYFVGQENPNGQVGLYATNGSSVELLKKIPFHIYDYVTNNITALVPNQEAIGYQNGHVIWNTQLGVFSYEIKTGALKLNWASIGSGVPYTLAGGILPINSYQYIAGYKNSTTYYLDTTAFGTGTAAYTNSLAESQLMTVGNQYAPKNLGDIEVILLKPMSATSGCKLQYRKSLSAAWTDIATIDYATYGARQAISVPSGIVDAYNVQIRIALDHANTTTPCIVKDVNIYDQDE